jgi:phosphatidylinositol alpha-1,6-mannosyltransferase
VLTPGMMGADGISTLTRVVVTSLQNEPPANDPGVLQVISLGPAESVGSLGGLAITSAGGRRSAFIARTLSAAVSGQVRDVVCLHLHLAPAALPLVARGARLTTILCGIESWKRLRPLEAFALRMSTHRIAISEHTVTRFRAANRGLAATSIQVCHPGLLDGPASTLDAEEPLAGEPYALVVGRLAASERYKGHDALLDLWPAVRERAPGALLVIAGDGDDRPRLQAKAAHLGLADHVQFCGRVSEQDLAKLYRGCHLFVMPSQGEGFGFVFLEAMRAGRPCIGGVGSASEIIVDGETGLVVDPSNRSALAEAVVTLFRDPALATRMGTSGRKRFERVFTVDKFRYRFRTLMGLAAESTPCVA